MPSLKASLMIAIAGGALLFGGYMAWPDRSEQISRAGVQPRPMTPPALSASSAVAQVIAATQALPYTASAPTQELGPKVSPNIGSEGYGPHIERAHQSDDPKAAWQAVIWLNQCANHAGLEEAWQSTLDRGVLPKEAAAFLTEHLAKHRAEAGRCQTVIDSHQAMLPDLALKAMRGKIPGAAAAYAGGHHWVQMDAAVQTEVRNAIRADAQAGDLPTLYNAFNSDEAWGLAYTERLGLMAAWIALQPPGVGQAVIEGRVNSGHLKMRAPSATELTEALLAARKIYETARKAHKPPGA